MRRYQSVNYVASHDGFPLYDLVSYNRKRNWQNGNNNEDGTDANYSWNCGQEGDEAVPPAVRALHRKQVKNFCCLLFLSNGTPMFRAGNEFLNTQFANNNPYNQDNEIGWLDWSQLRSNQDIFSSSEDDCVPAKSSLAEPKQVLAGGAPPALRQRSPT